MSLALSHAVSLAEEDAPELVGVIDIGSNSVRLVVYDGLHRAPIPVFNERVLCGLGRSITETRRLDREGAELAIGTLQRFQTIATDLGASVVYVLATAAVRDAEDGQEFVERLSTELGLSVRVLDGGEEARLSALGVVSGNPGADGIMGDLGGGSLELVELDKGNPRQSVTLPLGSLRVGSMRGPELRRTVESAIGDVAWLSSIKGRTLFAVGGSWRALARLHIAQNRHPVSIVHNYCIARPTAEGLTDLISQMSQKSLAGIVGVPRRRLDSLPAAATTMRHLLGIAQPREVIFSAYGVREGVLFDRLSAVGQLEDPLLAGCRQLKQRNGRRVDDGNALWSWLQPLFDSTAPDQTRLYQAACELCDIAWSAHPDYRADEALTRVIRAPLVGVDHPGRVFLGLAVYVRYGGEVTDDRTSRYRGLIDEKTSANAHCLGTALRFASAIAAGSNHLNEVGALQVDERTVVLELTEKGMILYSEPVARRFKALARLLGKGPAVIEGGPRAS